MPLLSGPVPLLTALMEDLSSLFWQGTVPILQPSVRPCFVTHSFAERLYGFLQSAGTPGKFPLAIVCMDYGSDPERALSTPETRSSVQESWEIAHHFQSSDYTDEYRLSHDLQSESNSVQFSLTHFSSLHFTSLHLISVQLS